MAAQQLKIIMRDTSTLIPYANNARKHSAQQVEQIAASITAYGFNAPVLTDGDSGIIAGHGRVMAAELLQLEQVPTISLAHLNDEQKRKYIIADNKISDNSEWDMGLLRDELLELYGDDNFDDIESIGFDDDDFNDVLGIVEKIELPNLNSGGKNVLEQITFTVHKTQMEDIKKALANIIEGSDFADVRNLNENKNGNALHALCKFYTNL